MCARTFPNSRPGSDNEERGSSARFPPLFNSGAQDLSAIITEALAMLDETQDEFRDEATIGDQHSKDRSRTQ